MADATVSCPSCNATVTPAVGQVERCTACGWQLRIEVQRVEASTSPAPSISPADSAQPRIPSIGFDPASAARRTGIGILLAAMTSNEEAYNELCCYTLALRDASFLHQYVVDAFAAQTADERTKPIKLAFALIGPYLHVEKGFSGRQVQRTHMKLAQHRHNWPSFALPRDRGSVTAIAVMAAPAGPERDQAIETWCASVWNAFRESRGIVVELLKQHGIV